MPYADLKTAARLHYEDLGHPAGTPLIAVHGFMGTARYDLGEVLDWLAAGQQWRVLGPTLRGYGGSSPKPRAFPHDFYQRDAADLLALMDALDIAQAHLLGYSDGGEVALIAAAQQPERFLSVLTWGAVGNFSPALLPAVQRMYPPTWLTPEQQHLHGIERAEPLALGWIRALTLMIQRGGDVSLSTAHRISAPLLLLLGEQDRLNPVACGQRLVQRAPRARLQTLPCGHAIHRELPDDFRRIVSAWLAEQHPR